MATVIFAKNSTFEHPLLTAGRPTRRGDGAMLPKLDGNPESKTILLVEDDILVRSVVAEALREARFTVVEAASADEAWAYLAADGKMDLLFSNIGMPGPANGVDLARRVRSSWPSVPVILASGSFRSQNIRELGVFLSKPFRLSAAISLVREALGINNAVDNNE
jgi:CheY-like chemotaxis protein